MNIEQVRTYTLSLPGVTEDMPFGDDVVTFRIEGKIFLALRLYGDEPVFALKLIPERNEELRAAYDAITPAWHWNKKHWSDISYMHFEDKQVQAWISESHACLVNQLPKRLRANYQP
ncbi:MAG: MmcQ/YjbR family DNA-binding protein [bacterium]|nr:MmcQ/YjbR family DNA-binding protein [bacterium]